MNFFFQTQKMLLLSNCHIWSNCPVAVIIIYYAYQKRDSVHQLPESEAVSRNVASLLHSYHCKINMIPCLRNLASVYFLLRRVLTISGEQCPLTRNSSFFLSFSLLELNIAAQSPYMEWVATTSCLSRCCWSLSLWKTGFRSLLSVAFCFFFLFRPSVRWVNDWCLLLWSVYIKTVTKSWSRRVLSAIQDLMALLTYWRLTSFMIKQPSYPGPSFKSVLHSIKTCVWLVPNSGCWALARWSAWGIWWKPDGLILTRVTWGTSVCSARGMHGYVRLTLLVYVYWTYGIGTVRVKSFYLFIPTYSSAVWWRG